jgi:hypothetical protein
MEKWEAQAYTPYQAKSIAASPKSPASATGTISADIDLGNFATGCVFVGAIHYTDTDEVFPCSLELTRGLTKTDVFLTCFRLIFFVPVISNHSMVFLIGLG